MKTWNQFFESKEKEEEKTGIDFDHDNEKGESKSHKNKVLKKRKEVLAFFEKRMAGAQKIATQAKAKGGPAKLTYWHFSAKHEQYLEIIKAIKEGKNEVYFRSKWKSLMSKLHNGSQKQEQFQKTSGMLETWGEVIAKLFN